MVRVCPLAAGVAPPLGPTRPSWEGRCLYAVGTSAVTAGVGGTPRVPYIAGHADHEQDQERASRDTAFRRGARRSRRSEEDSRADVAGSTEPGDSRRSKLQVRWEVADPLLAHGQASVGRRYLKMLTARAATSSTVSDESADSAAISSFAQRLRGIASVGLNAIELVNET